MAKALGVMGDVEAAEAARRDAEKYSSLAAATQEAAVAGLRQPAPRTTAAAPARAKARPKAVVKVAKAKRVKSSVAAKIKGAEALKRWQQLKLDQGFTRAQLRTPAGWPAGAHIDPAAGVSWLEDGWKKGMKVTSGGKLIPCYVSPTHVLRFFKRDVEKVLGRKLKAKCRRMRPLLPRLQAKYPQDAILELGPAKSATPYIQKRAAQADGKTVKLVLTTLKYKDAHGKMKCYGLSDLRYDICRKALVLKPAAKGN